MLPLDTIGGTGGLDTPTGNLFAESGKKLCICWYISLRTRGSIHVQYSLLAIQYRKKAKSPAYKRGDLAFFLYWIASNGATMAEMNIANG